MYREICIDCLSTVCAFGKQTCMNSLCVCLSVSVSLSLSLCVSVSLSLSASLSFCVSVCLSVCLCLSVSVCLSLLLSLLSVLLHFPLLPTTHQRKGQRSDWQRAIYCCVCVTLLCWNLSLAGTLDTPASRPDVTVLADWAWNTRLLTHLLTCS